MTDVEAPAPLVRQSATMRSISRYSTARQVDCSLATEKVSAMATILCLGMSAIKAYNAHAFASKVFYDLGTVSALISLISGISYVYIGLSNMR